ncbi:hypothetical protein AYI70_g11427, partial [Smittium culicis]
MRTFFSIATAVAIIAMNAATTSSSPAMHQFYENTPIEYVCWPNDALSETKYNTIERKGLTKRRPTVVLPVNEECKKSHTIKDIDEIFVDYTKVANDIVKKFNFIADKSAYKILKDCKDKVEKVKKAFDEIDLFNISSDCGLVDVQKSFKSSELKKLEDLQSRIDDMIKILDKEHESQ